MVRRAAPRRMQAYYEWMPIREDAQTLQARIYRTFRFGNLATLFMLDTRLIGRDEQMAREDTATIELPDRQLLGAEQEGWLAEQLVTSVRNKATLERARPAGDVRAANRAGRDGAGNPDSWDGYRAARARVFDMIERAKVDNFAVLTGDVHSSWAYDLPRRPVRRLRQGHRQGIDRRGIRRHVGHLAEQPRRADPKARSSSPTRWRRGRTCIMWMAATAATSSSTSPASGCRPTTTRVATVEERTTEGALREGIH